MTNHSMLPGNLWRAREVAMMHRNALVDIARNAVPVRIVVADDGSVLNIWSDSVNETRQRCQRVMHNWRIVLSVLETHGSDDDLSRALDGLFAAAVPTGGAR